MRGRDKAFLCINLLSNYSFFSIFISCILIVLLLTFISVSTFCSLWRRGYSAEWLFRVPKIPIFEEHVSNPLGRCAESDIFLWFLLLCFSTFLASLSWACTVYVTDVCLAKAILGAWRHFFSLTFNQKPFMWRCLCTDKMPGGDLSISFA